VCLLTIAVDPSDELRRHQWRGWRFGRDRHFNRGDLNGSTSVDPRRSNSQPPYSFALPYPSERTRICKYLSLDIGAIKPLGWIELFKTKLLPFAVLFTFLTFRIQIVIDFFRSIQKLFRPIRHPR